MSTRAKACLKQAKAKSKNEQKLEDADDFQAAGVDCEDAAGKWRAGDPIKSMRFFTRAVEFYSQGLTRFPQSTDLAYNKARVQLEIATHPMLVDHLPIPVLDALQIALESHRYALELDPGNADTLFNASQVLTSIGEILANDDARSDREALSMLEEALDLQDRCLIMQELKFEKDALEQANLSQISEQPRETEEAIDNDQGEGGASLSPSQTVQADQWFSIVEPVTPDTLVDTILAQLGTLTTLCSIVARSPEIAPESSLSWIEEYSTKLFAGKLAELAQQTPNRPFEIALTRATFVAALLEAGFRASKLDATIYRKELDAAFLTPSLSSAPTAESSLAYAQALISFNSALTDIAQADPSGYGYTRWTALDAAIKVATQVSKLSDATQEDKAKSQSTRGDAALLQHQLSLPPASYQTAISNKTQLLKNAEIFYKNASKLHIDQREKSVAGLRCAVVTFLLNGDRNVIVAAAHQRTEIWLKEQLDEMVTEGLLQEGFSV